MINPDTTRTDIRPPIRLLLSIPEAAAALGISRSKAYELVADGRLEAVHIGRCCRVPVEALTAYVEKLRVAR